MLLFCCVPVIAATVYKTVDDNGVVSFSDIRPDNGVLVETLVIDTPAPRLNEAAQDRLQAMRETTDRMAADRREREKHRAELRQQQAKSQSQPQYQQPYPADYVGYTTGYPRYYGVGPRRPWNGWNRPGRPGHRPGFRPGHRPEHPIARPPLRPQPLRGDYPASLIRKHYSPQVRAAFER